MLGYATGPADLARGRELDELRTGDLGRVDDRGLVHVVGRTSRFAKLFGLRLDLDEIERSLGPEGAVVCVSDDEVLAIGVVAPSDADAVAEAVGATRWACPARPSWLSPTTICPVSRPGSRTGSGCSPMPGLARPGRGPGRRPARPDRSEPRGRGRSVYREVLGCGAVAAVRHLRRPRRGLAVLRRGGDGARGAPR